MPVTGRLFLLEETKHSATFHWNRLIAQSSLRDPKAAVPLYKSMLEQPVRPNNHTFPTILKACAALRDPVLPFQLHSHLTHLGLLQSHPHACASLIDAYGKCRLIDDTVNLFEEIPKRDLDAFVWTSFITALSFNGMVSRAFHAFGCMRRYDELENRQADAVTLAVLVSASESLVCGKMLHSLVVKSGFESNVRLANGLVHMYATFGVVDDSLKCFGYMPIEQRDVVSWNTLIAAFVTNGRNESALSVFDEMISVGVCPSSVTLASVLKCCAQLGCSETSQSIHDYVMACHSSFQDDVVVMTALFDMHARCGNLEQAREIFDRIAVKNTVCWSAMIAGYELACRPEESLYLFKRMLLEQEKHDVKPNVITMLSVTAACSALGAFRPCRVIHKYLVATGLAADACILSALIDMYAKCGNIGLARKAFSEADHVKRSVVLWTAMIGAEGMHGEGKRALVLFSEMQYLDVEPNEVTFISLLSACNHSGLVKEGISCFRNMEENHGITPNAKHYACVVDLLGRAGKLDEALKIITEMPIEPDLAIWGSLLGSCHLHGNCKIGSLAEKKILSLDPSSSGHQVLLANMYSNTERWDDVSRMRVEMRNRQLHKEPGRSFIEVGCNVYGFVAEDRSHRDTEMIYKELQILDMRIRGAGYAKGLSSYPDTNRLIGSEYHSERLAIAFSMMMSRISSSGCETEPIRITKNLRICGDCHVYIKFVSKVLQKELTVRDSYRFHHFKDGFCSCRDYW